MSKPEPDETRRLAALDRLNLMETSAEMDGETAMRQLHDAPETGHIPVVAVSANAMREDVRRGLKAGFTDYLTKPVDMAYLFEHLEDWIQP